MPTHRGATDPDICYMSSSPSPDPLPPLVANTLPVFPTTTPTPPTHSKDDCKDGGWKDLGYFNQGQCIADAERGRPMP